MSDLISRSELLNNIRKEDLEYMSQADVIEMIENVINSQPTAYDPDKVVEELENASYFTQPTYDEDGYSNDDSEDVVALWEAIEIVKQGGFGKDVD